MKRVIGRTALLVLLAAMGVGAVRGIPAPQNTPGRRLAVVVGNNAYPSAPLLACRNDARSVAAALTEVGFSVTLIEDATRQRIADTLGKVAGQIRPDDVAFFYFSGHGAQVDGENFLVPVDYRGDSVEAVRIGTIGANEVQRLFQRARVTVLVLDACRTNPFARNRSGGSGLAAMEARGSLIAFATGSDQTAQDGPQGGNSVFTEALLQQMKQPGLTIQEVFRQARQRVYAATSGKQFPAVYDGLIGDLILRPGQAAAATPTSSGPANSDLARREELALWESIKDLKDSRVFKDYLQRYPDGRFKVAAESRLAELGRTAPTVDPTARPAGGFGPLEANGISLDGPFDVLLEKTAAIRGQLFFQFPNPGSLLEYLKDDPYWKKGEYSITSLSPGEDGILLVLSKMTNNAQWFLHAGEFPADGVRKKWDEGYRITEIGALADRWFVILTKNSGFGAQEFEVNEKWPADFIKKQWDLGRRITHTRWRDGKFVVVMSECQSRKIGQQRWKKDPDDAWIKESRDKGMVISLVTFGKDSTYMIMSAYEGKYDGYRLTDPNHFPASNLAARMAEGFWLVFVY